MEMFRDRRRRGVVQAAALATVLVLILAGCAQRPPASGETPAPAADEGTAAPRYGGTVTVALHGEIDKLDPLLSVTIVGFQVESNIYQSLVRANSTLDDMIPDLAEDWEISDDGKTYTFHLRRGVKFHNGKEFKAEDVEFSFNRVMDESFGSPRRPNYTPVDKLVVVDDYTVQFVLKFPYAPFLSKLEALRILPKSTDIDFNVQAVGTGPFKFVEWVPGSHIRLEKFADYWEPGKPYLDAVVFKPIPEPATKLVEFKTGNVTILPDVPFKDVAALAADPSFKVHRILGVVRDHFGFNMSKGFPFNNKAFRQAVAWAIDRESIAEAITYGYSRPSQVALPESHWAFSPTVKDYFGYDLEKARALLAEAGVPAGFTFTVKVSPTYPEEVKMAEVIQQSLAEIGVNMKIEQLEWSTWIDTVVAKGDYEAEIVLISGGIDPDDFFYQWHHTGEVFNIWRYSVPEMDALLEQAREETDQERRRQLYQQIQERIVDDAFIIHIIHRESVAATQKNVEGFVMTGRVDMDLRDVWLSSQ